MGVHGEYDVSYILVNIVGESLFASRMFSHEMGEVEYFVLVKEYLFSSLLSKSNPLILSLYHWKYGRFQL